MSILRSFEVESVFEDDVKSSLLKNPGLGFRCLIEKLELSIYIYGLFLRANGLGLSF
jgi:hypothetical protein